MRYTYLLNLMSASLIFNRDNIGYVVHTLFDFPNVALPIGGEMAYVVAAHHLAKEDALIGAFQGRTGYYHGPYNTLVSAKGYHLACVLFHEKAYVLIGQDGLPVMCLPEAIDSLVIPSYNHAIEDKTIVPFFSAASQHRNIPPRLLR